MNTMILILNFLTSVLTKAWQFCFSTWFTSAITMTTILGYVVDLVRSTKSD